MTNWRLIFWWVITGIFFFIGGYSAAYEQKNAWPKLVQQHSGQILPLPLLTTGELHEFITATHDQLMRNYGLEQLSLMQVDALEKRLIVIESQKCK